MLIHDTIRGLPVKGPSRPRRERLYCPVAFVPEKVLLPAHFTYADCLVYLCHVIVMARVRDPRYAKGHHDGFVPLNNRFMRNIIGHRRWQRVKPLAVECGLIECDASYRAGEFSMGYRLRSRYAEVPWKLREVRDEKLIQRLRKWREERHRAVWEKIRSGSTGVPAAVYEHLHRQLHRIRIDQCISESLTPEMAVAVDLIRRGQFFFHPDDHGRLHSNVTNLKRSLRAYLSVNGQRLVNLDVASSQPLFIGLLLLGDATHLRILYPIEEREGGERGEGSGVSICGARTPQSQGIGHNSTDLAKYVDLCQRGEFYGYVRSESGLGLDRDALKKQVFKVGCSPGFVGKNEGVLVIRGQVF